MSVFHRCGFSGDGKTSSRDFAIYMPFLKTTEATRVSKFCVLPWRHSKLIFPDIYIQHNQYVRADARIKRDDLRGHKVGDNNKHCRYIQQGRWFSRVMPTAAIMSGNKLKVHTRNASKSPVRKYILNTNEKEKAVMGSTGVPVITGNDVRG